MLEGKHDAGVGPEYVAQLLAYHEGITSYGECGLDVYGYFALGDSVGLCVYNGVGEVLDAGRLNYKHRCSRCYNERDNVVYTRESLDGKNGCRQRNA